MQILIIVGPNSHVKSFSFNCMKLLVVLSMLITIVMTLIFGLHYFSGPELPLANHQDKKSIKEFVYQDINHANEFKLMTLQANLESAENRLNQLHKESLRQSHWQVNQIEGASRVLGIKDHFGVRLERTLADSFSIVARLDRLQESTSSHWEYAKPSLGIPPLMLPLEISSQGGARKDPFTNQLAQHGGIDLKARYGDSIFATADGVVLRAGWDREYGYVIDLEHTDKTITRYAHAQELLVRQGDSIKRAQVIARVGSTGRSTGPHLHYEVLKNKNNLMRG